jgi:hypothetical protein
MALVGPAVRAQRMAYALIHVGLSRMPAVGGIGGFVTVRGVVVRCHSCLRTVAVVRAGLRDSRGGLRAAKQHRRGRHPLEGKRGHEEPCEDEADCRHELGILTRGHAARNEGA